MDLIKNGYTLISKNGTIVTAAGSYPSAKAFYTNKEHAKFDALNFESNLKIKVCKAQIVVDLDSEVT